MNTRQHPDDSRGRVIERPATIRFSHVDGAGIVFYARFFEMLVRAFDPPPIAAPPYAMQTEFLRPCRLGDRLTLVYRQGHDADDWSFAGRLAGVDHFTIRSIADDVPRHAADMADTAAPAFRAEALTVGTWGADPGGRLTLSRYFELVNEAIEQWFETDLDVPIHLLHGKRGIGIPTVRFTTRCRALPALGETVTIGIRPLRVGGRSLHFASTLWRGDDCLVENQQIVVFVTMTDSGFESVPVPDDIRNRLGKPGSDRVAS